MKIKTAVMVLAILPALAGCPQPDSPSADRLDCEHFGSQDQAQRAYERARTTDDIDPHHLDNDGNGKACDQHFPEQSPR
jgi:hypothetical protein